MLRVLHLVYTADHAGQVDLARRSGSRASSSSPRNGLCRAGRSRSCSSTTPGSRPHSTSEHPRAGRADRLTDPVRPRPPAGSRNAPPPAADRSSSTIASTSRPRPMLPASVGDRAQLHDPAVLAVSEQPDGQKRRSASGVPPRTTSSLGRPPACSRPRRARKRQPRDTAAITSARPRTRV